MQTFKIPNVLNVNNSSTTLRLNLMNARGKTLRIKLNGSSERTLCLCEVEIYGNIQIFELPIGEQFNLPEMIFNRIEFLQDNGGISIRNFDDVNYVSTEIQDISIREIGREKVLVSIISFVCIFYCQGNCILLI